MWDDLSRLFHDRFFQASRAAELRRDIVGIRQIESQSLYDYWEWYKKLCASCPKHGLTEQSLLQYFYEGLLQMEMKMIDTASGRALVNMTPQRARELISTMEANSKQYRPNSEPTRRVNGVNVSSLEDKLDKLTNIVQSMLTKKKNLTQLCGICITSEHPMDLCPILNDNSTEHVDAIGGFSGPLQRRYDHFSNTYNLEWKDHPNLYYGANPRYNLSYQSRPPQPPLKPSTPLEAIVERLTIEPNPRQNASAITLRSEKVLDTVSDKSHGQDKEREKQISDLIARLELEIQKPFVMPPPFLGRLAKDKKENEEKKSSKHSGSKRRLIGNERVNVGENVSAILQKKVPPTYKDQGPLKKTGVIIQLADRSVVYPEGLLEDVLVKVNELVFPVDIYIINMEDDNSTKLSDILLGRPFLSTASAKIDVRSGTLTMEFDGEIVKFNVYEAMSHPKSL
ncbi:uncharacterized protein LOC128036182 [Gossypium raimondii]|uniref:uncharacterized protein LOC128036182 n=1 Tax=Gossypium raimondii TaxID=29730 RepID=UPI00227C0452|nr:uncharacterized protein LOC128036182 [Gossypium raimondii]